MTPRYAVYFVPAAQSALYRFGAALLGYDCYSGTEIGFPRALPVPEPAWRELTQEPRRYGFHATLNAPFSFGGRRRRSRAGRSLSCVLPVEGDGGGLHAGGRRRRRLHRDRAVRERARGVDQSRRRLRDRLRSISCAAECARLALRRLAAALSDRQAQNLRALGLSLHVFEEDFRLHSDLRSAGCRGERRATVLSPSSQQLCGAVSPRDPNRQHRLAASGSSDARCRRCAMPRSAPTRC